MKIFARTLGENTTAFPVILCVFHPDLRVSKHACWPGSAEDGSGQSPELKLGLEDAIAAEMPFSKGSLQERSIARNMCFYLSVKLAYMVKL